MENFKNKYTAIACINNKNSIGDAGKLLYSIKGDMQNFKSLTTGNVVIMGRKTFEGIGHPLDNRVNIILTSDVGYRVSSDDPELYKDTYVCNSLEEVDALCYAYFSDRELFVIGGESVYNQYYKLGLIDKAILTLVNDEREGDASFPGINHDDNYRIIFKTMSIRNHSNDLYYRYVVYKKDKIKY